MRMDLLLNLETVTWQMVLMWLVGGGLIYLAICKKMEPSLLLLPWKFSFRPEWQTSFSLCCSLSASAP